MEKKKTVAVIQSNYIPWKGYFDVIHDADVFIFYDDVQYTKNDWRNRNLLKTPQGLTWLTVPVGKREDRLICEVEIQDPMWSSKHWQIIKQWYCQSTYFQRFIDFFSYAYLDLEWDNLSILNQFLIKEISTRFLGITTEFLDSRSYEPVGKKLDRLIDLLHKVGATQYISGPTAKNYIDEERFREAGIDLIFKDYSGFPEYTQFYPPFAHNVSILDLLFNTGADAPFYIWGWRK